jgi:hypothetical protein
MGTLESILGGALRAQVKHDYMVQSHVLCVRSLLRASVRVLAPEMADVSSPLGAARGARARGARARGPRARASHRSRHRPRSPCRHRRHNRGRLAMGQVNGMGGRL